MVTTLSKMSARRNQLQQRSPADADQRELKRIVFIHPFLLHYHYARLSALAIACQRIGVDLHNIQLAGYTQTYQSLWHKSTGQFQNLYLFPDRDLFRVPARSLELAVLGTLEQLDPDVIFLYSYSLSIMRSARSWAEKNNVASVLISDSNYTDSRRYWPLEYVKSLLVKRFDAAFVGGHSSSLYLHHLGLPEDRILAGYDVVDNELFQTQNSRNKQRLPQIRQQLRLAQNYFLFVGRMVKCKNVLGLLRSYVEYLQSAKGAPWDLVLCGDGPDEGEFRAYVDHLPDDMRSHISFRGLIRQPEIIDYFSAAACLILPSIKHESWGLVVNEALACGLPVIVSNRCGCAQDLVEDGMNGWRFDPTDGEELTARMLELHGMNCDARAEMGCHSTEIISRWGLDRFARGALESARIAIEHASRGKGNER